MCYVVIRQLWLMIWMSSDRFSRIYVAALNFMICQGIIGYIDGMPKQYAK